MLPLFVLTISLALGYAKSCSNPVLSTSYRTPVIASGYSLQLLTKNLTSPRHIVFDSSGNLLVAGGPDGIIALVLDEPENDGCINVREQKLIIENGDLNLEHGISLSPDGRTLYASSPEAAYSWSYDPTTISASNQRTLVTGMLSRGHITRTLLAPRSHPDFLIISRGSDGNLDYDAQNLASGKSMIKAFNITGISAKPYNYTTDGVLLGWGLRNSVGVGEDRFGGIWSVENSADQITRNGIDIHENNPAEEMNWHGYLNQTVDRSGYSGRNYGYPYCLAAWKADAIPSSSALKTGSQFALSPNATFGDEQCRDDFQSPRISFPAHTAPLDIKFHPKSGDAWVSFHGSWNRDDPTGYKLSVVPFSNGQPQTASDSASAAVDVVWNQDTAACPNACFRPVGVAFDAAGRVWMSSDSTGEIFVVTPPKNYGVAAGSPKNESGSSNSAFTLRVPTLCGLLWVGGIGAGLIMWA